ncbi:aromatic ring-hydroxylating dioxygenase subunit alpha [Burkholderia cepacia]|uniref:Aromatic ring-hydroxylating dioxygenase subunit alpha n=1 Tax=Burkholderia cepacia TaxID=292 RepID=A0AAX2RZ49_BURCE|nr:aromatic ring-hydroxylating dioxygenase subunit alpha [Burkholderia cepacia]TES77911.1 aromatic ring-hydroxylating dioxygenase subunit alpha [Burkholderia cepacia]TET02443.1 aromatic ring-hydroxylating dioxygenase subunit alpha [Burkholderia cepacia]TEU49975.1 aromatic ring-hydroxylating dioxygenase subunit alpha [Burkholderia cepacia]TEU54592.1 aromatic ring-hydroxylating dioxygenase subunit alpha [Burkholderia cepacia]TEU58641.1 aromatic ring-hydroxylating dioxygenase subunit alpha [Burkh
MLNISIASTHPPCDESVPDADGDAFGALVEQWYVAGTEADVKRDKPFGTRVLGLGIVLFRAAGGEIVALVDQCVHRGTRLSAGKVVDDCLVCPYHGWHYDQHGSVIRIPSIDGASAAPPGTTYPYRQRRLPVLTRHGLVWVYRGRDDPALKRPFDMPHYGERPWQSYYMVNTFDGDLGALVENFMDVPHTVFVHDRIFRSSTGRRLRASVELKQQSVEVTYHDDGDKIGMLDWLTNPSREPLRHTDHFYAPNVTRCDYHWGSRSSFLIISQITPLDTRRSRVYTYIAYRFALPAAVLRALKPLLHLYTHSVIQQDVRIMRAHREGLDNAAGFTPSSVRADVVHIAIGRLLAAAQRGEPLPDAQCGTKPMEFVI